MKLKLESKASYRARQRRLASMHRLLGNEESDQTQRMWRWALSVQAARRVAR